MHTADDVNTPATSSTAAGPDTHSEVQELQYNKCTRMVADSDAMAHFPLHCQEQWKRIVADADAMDDFPFHCHEEWTSIASDNDTVADLPIEGHARLIRHVRAIDNSERVLGDRADSSCSSTTHAGGKWNLKHLYELWLHAFRTSLLMHDRPDCALARLTLWSVLLCGSVIQARLLALTVLASMEVLSACDRVVDPLVLPEGLIASMYSTFPGLPGVGSLGISDAWESLLLGREIADANDGESPVEVGLRLLWKIPMEIGRIVVWSLRPQVTPEDLVLGAAALATKAYMVGASPYVAQWLVQVPSPLSDMQLLLRGLVPQPSYLPGLLLWRLPAAVYAVRWLLAATRILPMSAMSLVDAEGTPDVNSLAMHVFLGLLLLIWLSGARTGFTALSEEFRRNTA